MNTEEAVREVVDSFVQASKPFTALDISNIVKDKVPGVRHSDVSPIVRFMFSNGEITDYDRTDISVTKEDGSQVRARLYHSITDSWDLDNKYSDALRAQKAKPVGKYVSEETVLASELAQLDCNDPNWDKEAKLAAAQATGMNTDLISKIYSPDVADCVKDTSGGANKTREPDKLPPSVWTSLFGKFKTMTGSK